jgi:hypothetical protein
VARRSTGCGPVLGGAIALLMFLPGCFMSWLALGSPLPRLDIGELQAKEATSTGPGFLSFDYSHGLPDFKGKPTQQVGAALIHDGFRVLVRVDPRLAEGEGANAKPIKLRFGDYFNAGLNPARVVAFERKGGWDHPIAAQDPLPGMPLPRGGTVTLTVGRHNGGIITEPWVTAHKAVVKKHGAVPCFKCHLGKDCPACHTKMIKPIQR